MKSTPMVEDARHCGFARRAMLAFLDRLVFLDDSEYLKIRYKLKMGKRLNLDSPKTFNEKLQWLKIHDRNPLYTKLVDKASVKSWVAERIGCEHVVPTLGVWDSFDKIDFDMLPERFVLKCTHDSGGLAICSDRATFDIKAARKKIERSLRRNYFYHGREWPYKDVPPRVLAEEFLDLSDGMHQSRYEGDALRPARSSGLIDYKFYCFSGEPRFLYVSQGLDNHATARISFLSLDWNIESFRRSDYAPFEVLPGKPRSFDEMIAFAKVLAKGIPFVRVDFYDGPDGALFSEMTFSPCSGMTMFEPLEADELIGRMLQLPVAQQK